MIPTVMLSEISYLIEISLRLKSVLRSSDILARTGGDEYLIILPRMAHEKDIAKTDSHNK